MMRAALAALTLACLAVPGAWAQEPDAGAKKRADAYPRPIPVSRPQPIYPRSAMRDGVEGTVDLQIEVLADGSVGTVQVLKEQPLGVFQGAAIAAVRNWRFKPSEFPSRLVVQPFVFSGGGVDVGAMMNLPPEATQTLQIRQTPEGAVLELPPPKAN